jgi:hypothetical protein
MVLQELHEVSQGSYAVVKHQFFGGYDAETISSSGHVNFT